MISPRQGSVPLLLLTIGLVGCNAPSFATPRRVFDLDAGPLDAGAADLPGPARSDGAAEWPPDAPAEWPPDGQAPPAPPDAGAAPDVIPCAACAPDQYCLGGQCATKPELASPPLAPCARPPCINVYNNCPVPLWTHAVATVPLDDGLVRKLNPGEQFQYAALPRFGGGRLYAYYKEPENKQDRTRLVSDFNQFVEMTVDSDPTGAIAQNYNISYVDYASLPVSMKAAGAGCGETRCGTGYAEWVAMLKRCPTDLRFAHEGLATCTASYNYCISRDAAGAYDDTRPYCSKMRDAHGFPGSAVYGGVFPDRASTEVAFWDGVAAWNRGTIAGDSDESHYYRTEPFNHYARWIHGDLGCLGVYAFSTDDHQDKAGFVRCSSPELNVVWCPYKEITR